MEAVRESSRLLAVDTDALVTKFFSHFTGSGWFWRS